MRLIDLEQRSPEWQIWRKNGIGSSDIAAISGKSPWCTPYQVWEKLMGFRESEPVNPAMQRGIDYEDEARAYLGDPDLKPVCIEHDHYHYFHASLDGLGKDYFCEIKVPSSQNFASYEQDIPEHYYIQVQWQFLVSGLKRCIFLVYSPEKKFGYKIEVEPDEQVMDELERKASNFWYHYQNGIAPDLTEKDKITIEDPNLQVKCIEYMRLNDTKKRAESTMKNLKEEIVAFGNNSNFTAYGINCFRVAPRSSYDIEAMKMDGIDVSKYRKMGKSESSFSLRIGKE